ncbi:MAG: hypothetical protein V4530_02085 [Pseudomonadota bacterium]
MTKTLIAFSVLAAAVAQPALAETFTRDGSTYTYTVEKQGKVTLISGRIEDTKQPFRFRVSGTRVNGSIDGRWVSFSTRDVVSSKPGAQAAVIAAR